MMLEGTANGDRKLEGTEHELSSFGILFGSVIFTSFGWKMRDATNFEQKMINWFLFSGQALTEIRVHAIKLSVHSIAWRISTLFSTAGDCSIYAITAT